jgi:acyl-CoA reductase-like NAD-dependent aldehyde dehydrogenase
MRMPIDGEWVDAADGRVEEIRDKATGELIETTPHSGTLDVTRAIEATQRSELTFGGTKMSGNAREGLLETLLDMAEQKTLLMSGVFSA